MKAINSFLLKSATVSAESIFYTLKMLKENMGVNEYLDQDRNMRTILTVASNHIVAIKKNEKELFNGAIMLNVTCNKTVPAQTPIKHRNLINVNACEGTNMIEKKDSIKVYLFASVLRSDMKSRPFMQRVKATSEKEARRQLVRDYILAFAGCLPVVNEVHYA